MHLATAISALRLIEKGCVNGDLSAAGILDSEYELLKQELPWRADQRAAVERVLNTMIYGTMDSAGIPRIHPPAEYIAAVISSFVGGANVMVACRWMEGAAPADELASEASGPWIPASAEQLFACVLQLEHQTGGVRDAFEKKVGLAIKRTTAKTA